MGAQLWTRIRHLHWHQWARIIAVMLLVDQLSLPPNLLPVSEAIIVACIGALFAPVPTERRQEPRK